jgi:hypothetical protein
MNYNLILADVSLTLMILQANGDFAPSDVMRYPYFVFAPETFTANLVENATNLMIQIYDEHYIAFKQREPDDPNYIAVVEVQPRTLSNAELAERPWLKVRPPAWETSHCILITENSFRNIDPNALGGLLGLDPPLQT